MSGNNVNFTMIVDTENVAHHGIPVAVWILLIPNWINCDAAVAPS